MARTWCRLGYGMGCFLNYGLLVTMAVGCGGQVDDPRARGRTGGSAGSTAFLPDTPLQGGSTQSGPAGAPGVNTEPPDLDEGWITVSPSELSALVSNACMGEATECEALPVVLQFVVDLGSGMARPGPNSSLSNWELTRHALIPALDRLPALAVGISFFPHRATTPNLAGRLDAAACIDSSLDVPIAPLGPAGSSQRSSLAQALLAAEPDPEASTPTHDAYLRAVMALDGWQETAKKAVVLVTDGQPTLDLGCYGWGAPTVTVATSPIVQEVRNAKARGIGTLVIGAPGSSQTAAGEDARPWLSLAAFEGGVDGCSCPDTASNACHIDLTKPQHLGESLGRMVGYLNACAFACEYGIPEPPEGLTIDRSNIQLVYTGVDGLLRVIQRSDRQPCEVGWQLSQDQSKLMICPKTCQYIQCAPSATLQLDIQCVPVEGSPTQ